jgi:hypothetical protein
MCEINLFKIPVSISVHYSNVLIFPLLRLDILVAVNVKVVVCTAVLQFGHISADIMSLCMQSKDCVHLTYCYSNCTQFMGHLWTVHMNVHAFTHVCAQRAESVTLGFCILIPISTAPSGLKL